VTGYNNWAGDGPLLAQVEYARAFIEYDDVWQQWFTTSKE